MDQKIVSAELFGDTAAMLQALDRPPSAPK